MTNQQSNKELVKAGHAFAAAMSMDTPIIVIAKMVTELANRLDVMDACNKAMAVESTVARKAVQVFCDVVGSNTDAICEEVGSDGVRAILAAMSATGNMPATDDFLNSLRADVIPEGYALVPQQMCLPANAMEAICFHCGDGDHVFGEFTDGILWVGEIDHGDGTKTYGLNIATADYPDEGSGVVSEFIKPSFTADSAKEGE
ncbi:hypothetical protein [Pantoea rwandensis]|uniref:Uncharacterized protein n=1 Tax=Pantoea rwandensis TaxID=1076550 RepID=A0A1X1CP47_9GAMM|nr:hypothetical protein HA51_23945 [Pantoea rwandensis]